MKEILSLTMGSAAENLDQTFDIFNKAVRVKQLGVDFNIELLKQLLIHYKDQFDVITISGLPNSVRVKGEELEHALLAELKEISYPTPIVDGSNLRNLVVPWAINQFVKQDPGLFKNKKVGFFSGVIQKPILKDITQQGARIYCADLFFIHRLPVLIRKEEQLDQLLLKLHMFWSKKKLGKLSKTDFSQEYLTKIPSFNRFFNCDIFFLNRTQLDYLILPDLTGKTVFIDCLTEKAEKILKSKNVKKIYQASLNVDEKFFQGFTQLEALFQLLKDEQLPLSEKDILSFIEGYNLRPQAATVFGNGEKEEEKRFAFIIHPLSVDHLLKIPGVRKLKKYKSLANRIEYACSKFPSFHYGQIKGIKSDSTGSKAVGDIFVVTETPKMMLSKSPKRMYSKLVNICKKADLRSNQIIGLGAYTKIVGDAGVTVNKYSPIPVTTGNSLSAASTLWAASYAVDKMRFLKKEKGIYPGTVMIVGATGSIGKVNAKILCQCWKKVVIVAPKLFKLIDLKDELKLINPDCEISYGTNPAKFASECDLIITTTSAQGKKVIDIADVKSGSVICDVSRPFDISEEDMLSRPDVLVIASGEVELPGQVEINIDIGLRGNAVYACLAETALLALEEKYESFSLSRDISYQKVFEIDRIARKHGVRLSGIMGHELEITDDEIELCRQHALKNRAVKEEKPLVDDDNLLSLERQDQ